METKKEFLSSDDTRKFQVHAKNAEMVDIDEIIPYGDNPKNHSKESVEAMAHTIDKRGWTYPLLIDQHGRLAAGHRRREAAKLLKLRRVPVIRMDMTEAEYLKILLEDNRLGISTKISKNKEKGVMELLLEMDELINDIPVYSDEELDKIFGLANKETIDGSGDFGDAGEVDGEIDPDARIVTMTFKLPKKNHTKIKDHLTAIQRENELETLSEALIFAMNSFKGTTKTIRR